MMATKIDAKKGGSAANTPQDNSNEMRQRWKHLQIVLRRTRRHPAPVDKGTNFKLQDNLTSAAQFISTISSLVTLFLVARIGLKIIAVNSGTPFGRFIVDLTNLFLWPFSNMTETLSAPHISLLELSSLTAVTLYPFAAWCLSRLLYQLFPLHIH